MILPLVFCIFLPFKDLNMLIFLEVEGKKKKKSQHHKYANMGICIVEYSTFFKVTSSLRYCF